MKEARYKEFMLYDSIYIYRERVKRQVTLIIKSVRNQGTLAGMDNALKE